MLSRIFDSNTNTLIQHILNTAMSLQYPTQSGLCASWLLPLERVSNVFAVLGQAQAAECYWHCTEQL